MSSKLINDQTGPIYSFDVQNAAKERKEMPQTEKKNTKNLNDTSVLRPER